jgi:hypothetical protein
MTLYMGGRQIFETSQEVHIIREEYNKMNKQVTDKLILIQMSLLLVLY